MKPQPTKTAVGIISANVFNPVSKLSYDVTATSTDLLYNILSYFDVRVTRMYQNGWRSILTDGKELEHEK